MKIPNCWSLVALELFAFVRAVLAIPTTTVAGVKIKAQTCAALARMQSHDSFMEQMGDSTKNKANKANMAGLLGKAFLEVI